MRKTVKKKFNKKGFTLVELLAAIAIMSLFSTIVIAGINLALKSYESMTTASHCRVLEDNINTAFAGIVRSSTFIKEDSEGKLHFKSEQYSATLAFGSMELVDGQIQLIADDEKVKEYANCQLISPTAYDMLSVKDLTITYSNEGTNALLTLSYKISYKISGKTINKPYTCSYRTVNTDKVEVYVAPTA